MKKALLAISLVALFFSSCGDGKMSLMGYHEKVVKTFNTASEKMYNEREILFKHELSKEENQKLIEGLHANLDSCITMMNEINYPEDAKDFHESMLKIYQFQKDSIMPVLSNTLDYKPESKDWYKLWNEFDKRTRRVDGLLRDMEKCQTELASKANAKVR